MEGCAQPKTHQHENGLVGSLDHIAFSQPGKKQVESLDHFAFSRPGKKQIGSLSKLAWLSRLFVHGGLGATKTGSLDHFAFSQPGKKLKVWAGKKQTQSLSRVGKNQFISGLQSKIKELWPNG